MARAISLCALIASMVGKIPIIPTMAVTRISISGKAAIWRSPSIPQITAVFRSEILSLKSSAAFAVHITASLGSNSRTCSSRSFTLLPAARAVTCSLSGYFLTISSVCVPIEPVEPIIPIFFMPLTISVPEASCSFVYHLYAKQEPYHQNRPVPACKSASPVKGKFPSIEKLP